MDRVRERDKEIDQNRNRPTDQPNRGTNKKNKQVLR